MPISFILTIILFISAIVAAIVWIGMARSKKKGRTNNYGEPTNSSVAGYVTLGLFALTVMFIVMASVTTVSTKTVGIVTTFGRPTGTPLSNGLHFKAPWQKVTEFDAAIQTDTYSGDSCTKVRLGTEGTACVNNSVQWRIVPNQAGVLFQDYKDFSKMSEALVKRERVAALNDVFSDFDPLNKIKDDTAGSGSPTLKELSDEATNRLRERLGDRIEVDSVLITLVNYDENTQSKINAYQAEIANTRIAEQRQETATAEALANEALANSVSKDPNVLVSKCLDTLAVMVKEGQAVPAGFSCWPGGQGALVVPSAK